MLAKSGDLRRASQCRLQLRYYLGVTVEPAVKIKPQYSFSEAAILMRSKIATASQSKLKLVKVRAASLHTSSRPMCKILIALHLLLFFL